jgi:hypothetical protein
MNMFRKNLLLSLIICAAYVPAQAQIGNAATEFGHNENGYAERLYQDLSMFSGGKVTFVVTSTKYESLGRAGDLTVKSFITTPAHILDFTLNASTINQPQFIDINPGDAKSTEWSQKIADYKIGDMSLESGTMRLLSIKAKIGNDVRTSEGVEVCWSGNDNCHVVDNTISGLKSLVESIRRSSQPRSKAADYNCQIDGTTLSRRTRNFAAKSKDAIYASTKIGTVDFGTVKLTQWCEKDTSQGCLAAQSHIALGANPRDTRRGYSVVCRPAVHQYTSCGSYSDFALERGCAYYRAGSAYKFGFQAFTVGCNAEVTRQGESIVAYATDPIDEAISCNKVSTQ